MLEALLHLATKTQVLMDKAGAGILRQMRATEELAVEVVSMADLVAAHLTEDAPAAVDPDILAAYQPLRMAA